MTERLYDTDPYCREFDATVTDVRAGAAGGWLVQLDRTAFYPTSGGQPFDVGTLGDAHVTDVTEDEESGAILHVVDRPLQHGAHVHGSVDWARRFDHMQQHTGQHVLSAALDRLFGVRTISFHLGAVSSTIDIARELSTNEIGDVQADANRIVWEDREVSIKFVSDDEAAQLPLRKESRRHGTLRIIDVAGFDLSACGGTHVARTGAIGALVIRSTERFKGGQRLEFLCGGRAVSAFGALAGIVDACVRLTSAAVGELPATIERYQADAKDQKRSLTALQIELSRYKAADLLAQADRGVVFHVADADANGLKAMAAAIAGHAGHAAILATPSAPALVVVASAPDGPVQANRLLAALIARFGGRGGGKPELAQGGGLHASGQQVLDAAREAIGSETHR